MLLVFCLDGFFLNSNQTKSYIPSVFVFLTTNLIRYQLWELDNTKVFYSGWISFAVPVVTNFFSVLYHGRSSQEKIIGITLFLILMISCCLSAFISSLQSLHYPTHIFTLNDYRIGLWIAEHTSPTAIFLANLGCHNIVSSIAGRQVFCGYSGWVVSHGLNNQRIKISNELEDDLLNVARIRSFNISYYVTKDFNNPPNITQMEWRLVLKYDPYLIYYLPHQSN